MPSNSIRTSRPGVVAILTRLTRLLVIRRSQSVEAPGMVCFPGGGIEAGETEEDALRREVKEELAVDAVPSKRLWKSVTGWGVELAWWSATIDADATIVAHPDEVESTEWLEIEEIRALPNLLESNHHFLDALARKEFEIDGLGN